MYPPDFSAVLIELLNEQIYVTDSERPSENAVVFPGKGPF